MATSASHAPTNPGRTTKFLRLVWRVGRAGGGLASAILLALGFISIGIAVISHVRVMLDPTHDGGHALLHGVLGGLELLFLAPLPYLAVERIGGYLFLPHVATTEGRSAHGKLLEVKGIITSLIVTVLATNVLSHALQDTMTFALAGGTAIIILTLTLFFFGMEWLAGRK